MAETDTTPVSASIASTGKGIRYVGKEWVYANSGKIATVTTNTMTLLEFETGPEILKAQISMVTFGVTAEDFQYKINFNDQQINEVYYIDSYDSYTEDSRNFFYIIPPFTKVKITGQSIGGGAGTIGAMLTGRVYGAE